MRQFSGLELKEKKNSELQNQANDAQNATNSNSNALACKY